jgi:hypothetical protein
VKTQSRFHLEPNIDRLKLPIDSDNEVTDGYRLILNYPN